MYFIEKTCLYSSCDKVFITTAESRGPNGRLPSQPVCAASWLQGHRSIPSLTPCLGPIPAGLTPPLFMQMYLFTVSEGRHLRAWSVLSSSSSSNSKESRDGPPQTCLSGPNCSVTQRRQDKGPPPARTLLSAAPVRCLSSCVWISRTFPSWGVFYPQRKLGERRCADQRCLCRLSPGLSPSGIRAILL